MPQDNLCVFFRNKLVGLTLENLEEVEDSLQEEWMLFNRHVSECENCLSLFLEKIKELIGEETLSEEEQKVRKALIKSVEKDEEEVRQAVRNFIVRFPELDFERFGGFESLPNFDSLTIFYAVDAIDMLLDRYFRRMVSEGMKRDTKLFLCEDGSVTNNGIEVITSQVMIHEVHMVTEYSSQASRNFVRWVVNALMRQPTLFREFDVSYASKESSKRGVFCSPRANSRNGLEGWQ